MPVTNILCLFQLLVAHLALREAQGLVIVMDTVEVLVDLQVILLVRKEGHLQIFNLPLG